MSPLKENVERVRRRLYEASGGREVFLLPVTKTRAPEEILPLKALGIDDIGENRVQEYLQKRDALGGNFRLHMIGQLQSNKVRGIIEDVYLIHSVDRESLAREIQRQAAKIARRVDLLIQVNIAGEEQKAGVSPEGLPALLDAIAGCANLRLRGLMTIAPLSDDPEEARPIFAEARRLFERIRGPGIDILSMGMSDDCLVAAQEGSTLVRIGSALFGERASVNSRG